MGFLRSKWFIQGIGIAALSALVWFLGPLIAVAGRAPLEPTEIRIAVIAGLVVLWVTYRLIQRFRSGQKDKQLMAELAAPPQKSPTEEATSEELDALRRHFEEALDVLRDSRNKDKRGGQQFLYELPWYVIIGAPGSGKTTALVNSGLKFPLAERMGHNPVKGISGTRNCDWWFTDEAVFLDTAGRYTTQDSHQAVDAAAWQGFLQMLKKYRPRQPLNGVLIATSLPDLLLQSEEERRIHAKAIRRRVQELRETLGVRLPIYMMFTKSDLVAGFTDFFADLSQDDRAQVWGETFTVAEPERVNEQLERYGEVFDELMQRLGKRSLKRVQEEKEIQRRAQILDYPEQMALLKPALQGFLQDVYGTNRFEESSLLRGIYFTSGTQEGTPIDRVLGAMAAAFRLDRQAAPNYSGKGKSFFLTRLLRDVIFKEAGLAGVDPKVERRSRLLQYGAFAAAALATMAGIAIWTTSYFRNQSAIAEVERHLDEYQQAPTSPGNDLQSKLGTLLPRLNALVAARDVYENAGWWTGFGLSQGGKLTAGIEHAYRKQLQNNLLPLVKARLEERMTGAEAANADVLYELLRVYLMLGQPKRLDPAVVAPWVRLDWERAYASDPKAVAQLAGHLEQLLQLPPEPLALNDTLISGVRARLTQVPQAMQVYARFRSDQLLHHEHDLKLAEMLGPGAERVLVPADGKSLGAIAVPGLFTAWGYTEVFLKNSLNFVKQSLQDNWVIGQEKSLEPAEIDRFYSDVRKLYLAEYQQTWSGLLDNLKLRRAQNKNQTIDLLDALGRPDSPLRTLLEAVAKNTSLTKLSSGAADLLNKVTGQDGGKPPDERTQQMLDAARQATGMQPAGAVDPAQAVENYFEPYNKLVRGTPERPAPLEGTLKAINALRDQIMQGGAPPGGGGAAAAGGGRPPLEFNQLPAPLKKMLDDTAKDSQNQSNRERKEQLNDLLKTGVAAPCRAAIGGRYPFARGSGQDVALIDLGKMFAPGTGVFDQYYQTHLKTVVDTTAPDWRELGTGNQALGLSPASLRQFQLANRIREAFFPAGGPLPQVRFELTPVSLDDKAASFRLNVEGQEVLYRHGPVQTTNLQWPGTAPGSGVRWTFETLDGAQTTRSKEGAWAWFRALDASGLGRTGTPDRFLVNFQADSLYARFELKAASVTNPFSLGELAQFHCPDGF